jgi:hypothetical protein
MVFGKDDFSQKALEERFGKNRISEVYDVE